MDWESRSARKRVRLLLSVLFAVTVGVPAYLLLGKNESDYTASVSYGERPETRHQYNRTTVKKLPLPSEVPKEFSCRKNLPGAIVIGVKKCGTYALKTFLQHHPGIALRIDRMVEYFSSPNFSSSLETYRDMMACSTPGQLTMEGSPGYFHVREAPARIKATLPNIKMILLLRDPVRRAVSDYLHLMDMEDKEGPRPFMYKTMPQIKEGSRYEIGASFEEAVSHPNGSLKTYNLELVKGRYVDFIPRWWRHFSPQRILILDGDRFSKNPLPTLKQVEAFLGVKPYFTSNHFKFSQEKGFFCLKLQKQNGCLGETKGRPHPKINDSLLQTLHEYFDPFNRKLNTLLNQTFIWST